MSADSRSGDRLSVTLVEPYGGKTLSRPGANTGQ